MVAQMVQNLIYIFIERFSYPEEVFRFGGFFQRNFQSNFYVQRNFYIQRKFVYSETCLYSEAFLYLVEFLYSDAFLYSKKILYSQTFFSDTFVLVSFL